MKVTKENLKLENALNKEWIITNGIGGYSSSTIIGANTRKYHGLLIAPLTPPARRYLILSKIDESIEISNKTYDLYPNIIENYCENEGVYKTQNGKYQTANELYKSINMSHKDKIVRNVTNAIEKILRFAVNKLVELVKNK